jgi:ABC-type hemin transport system substrate-binding protein
MAEKLNVPTELLQHLEAGEPTVKISRSMGFTVNLQGYESARIDATIEITGSLENKDKIAEAVQKELEQQIQSQIKDIVDQHDPNKTLLGYRK